VSSLRVTLRPEFLADAGWDQVNEVLAPPRRHLLLELRKCVVFDCAAAVRRPGTELCQPCSIRFTESGLPLEHFAQTPSGKRNKGENLCRVPGCE
jgi:hypothetical protein